MIVLHTCKNKKYQIENEAARMLTILYVVFFSRSRVAYSEVNNGILPKFEPFQAFIVVLVICKNEEDPIKDEGARLLTRFPPLYVYGTCFRRSMAANSAVLVRIRTKCDIMFFS